MSIDSPREAFSQSEPRPTQSAKQSEKKNYAERLSRNLATAFANGLRKEFPGILPNRDGSSQESKSRSAKGLKKLDVNYSTVEMGLGLGVSIKTINFMDDKTKRFTKNYSRVDNELRAEATDYHTRQPYATLVAVLFLPESSCLDKRGTGLDDASSFGAAVRFFRSRIGRDSHRGDVELFEGFLIGLYPENFAEANCFFFDVATNPPRDGLPKLEDRLDFQGACQFIRRIYDARNNPPFEWAT